MLYQHAADIISKERKLEILHYVIAGRKIAVRIGRAEHLTLRGKIGILRPDERFVVPAALDGKT